MLIYSFAMESSISFLGVLLLLVNVTLAAPATLPSSSSSTLPSIPNTATLYPQTTDGKPLSFIDNVPHGINYAQTSFDSVFTRVSQIAFLQSGTKSFHPPVLNDAINTSMRLAMASTGNILRYLLVEGDPAQWGEWTASIEFPILPYGTPSSSFNFTEDFYKYRFDLTEAWARVLLIINPSHNATKDSPYACFSARVQCDSIAYERLAAQDNDVIYSFLLVKGDDSWAEYGVAVESRRAALLRNGTHDGLLACPEAEENEERKAGLIGTNNVTALRLPAAE